jgi:dTDP-4-amino-4,6-dideoxygalactose transaminase
MSELALLGGEKLREEPFHKWPVYDKQEEENLISVLRKNKWGIGKRVGVIQEFENKFAEHHEAASGVACTNCTHALEIMLSVAGVGYGDEVIVPAYTFIATASAVAKIGAIPVFADIDPQTYQLDVTKIEALITPQTKAIIPVYFSGHFVDMEKLMGLADKHNLTVIEDAAQAHGGKWNGHFAGSWGVGAGFSFQYSKNMTAGEGGIIISKDKDFIENCWEHIWHGRKKGGIWYEHFESTSNFRITEWSAAVLLAQLEKLPKQNQQRMENAAYLTELLENDGFVTPAKVDSRTEIHPRHLYIARLNQEIFGGISKETILKALNAEGIPALPGYGFPLYKTPAFQSGNWGIKGQRHDYSYNDVYLPVAEKACKQVFWILHSVLLGTHKDMEDIANGIRKVAENVDDLGLQI